MNAMPFTVYCSLCGEEGVGSARTAAAEWDADAVIHHSNPRICADNLQRQKRDLEARIQSLEVENERLSRLAHIRIPIPKWLRRKKS